jgi:hypothetical protein
MEAKVLFLLRESFTGVDAVQRNMEKIVLMLRAVKVFN